MMKISAFTKQHPLLTYLTLTFAISWGGILLVVGRGGFTANGDQNEKLLILMYLAMLAGPSISSIMLTRVVYGRAGLHDLAYRLIRWRVGSRWYVAALLVGIFEELGWTGFAVHTLLKRRCDILSTGLIVGLLFGTWNFLVVFLMSGMPVGAGELSLAIFLPATLFTWLPTYRVLMVWVYERTGSLLLSMLMYASLIAFWTMLTPLTLSGLTLVIYYLIFTAAMWIVIATVLWWKALPRPQHA